MKVRFKEFSGRSLCEREATFASKVGKDNLIGTTQTSDGGLLMAVVWYWA
jgi:hypothetical protein